jgi:hypothetical protein
MPASPKKRQPSLRYKIRTGDVAVIEGAGNCTDRQGFAVYMIALLGDQPKPETPVARAVADLLAVCEKALAEVEKGDAVKIAPAPSLAPDASDAG